MKQIWISKKGSPDTLTIREDVDPTPRNGEVRIRVEFCGVSAFDVLGRRGRYSGAPRPPFVPGREAAGVVDAVTQGVAGLKEGDRVFAALPAGGYSDVVCAPHKQVFRMLDWMTAADGAALAADYAAAYQLAMRMGALRPGDRILIHGAATGVGLAVIDIAKIVGAQLYATAPANKHEFLTERGVLHLVDHRREDYERFIAELTAEKGVDLVVDPTGREDVRKNYRVLSPNGRLLYCGDCAPPSSLWRRLRAGLLAIPPAQMRRDNKAVIGLNNGRLWEYFEQCRPWMEQIIAWYDEALFRPAIDQIFKFDQVAEAHGRYESGLNNGKILLKVER